VPLIVFANEFFDALPVEIVSPQGSLLSRLKTVDFIETWVPSSAEELAFIDRFSVHPASGERIEVSLLAQQRMSSLAASMRRGVFIASTMATLVRSNCGPASEHTDGVYRHTPRLQTPYEAPGDQDNHGLTLTSPSLAAAMKENGMDVRPLLTQSQFLMGVGEVVINLPTCSNSAVAAGARQWSGCSSSTWYLLPVWVKPFRS